MAGIYDELQGVASEILSEFQQGTVRYIHPGEQTGPDYDPQPGTPTPYSVNATKTPQKVKQKYVDGGYIVASDFMLNVAAFDIEPVMDGEMEINGVKHQIIMIDPATMDTDAPIIWRIGCRS